MDRSAESGSGSPVSGAGAGEGVATGAGDWAFVDTPRKEARTTAAAGQTLMSAPPVQWYAPLDVVWGDSPHSVARKLRFEDSCSRAGSAAITVPPRWPRPSTSWA